MRPILAASARALASTSPAVRCLAARARQPNTAPATRLIEPAEQRRSAPCTSPEPGYQQRGGSRDTAATEDGADGPALDGESHAVHPRRKPLDYTRAGRHASKRSALHRCSRMRAQPQLQTLQQPMSSSRLE